MSLKSKASRGFAWSGLILVTVLAAACGQATSGSSVAPSGSKPISIPTSFSILPGVPTFGENPTQGLFQVHGCNPSVAFHPGQASDVTTPSAGPVKSDQLIQVNSRFLFLKDVSGMGGDWSAGNVILDLSSGQISHLTVWPDDGARIYANMTDAFFVSSGSIYEVNFGTGASTLVSTGGQSWGSTGKLGVKGWSAQTRVFVDGNLNLYATDYQSLDKGKNVGMASEYLFQNGEWIENSGADETFFSTMPNLIAGEIPGALLINDRWILSDSSNSKMYEVHLDANTITLYPYDFSQWSDGEAIYTKTLSRNMAFTTFLGTNDTIQDGVMTDGQSILRFSSNSAGVVSMDEIAVPESIPVESSVHGQPSSAAHPGSVTNWNYLNGDLYYLNPDDQAVYCWDLDPNDSPVAAPWASGLNLSFLFK